MATSVDYIEFVYEQIRGMGRIRYRKMFGEYCVYVNDKPILLVCDNTVFVKKAEEIAEYMQNAETGFPYDGAKEHYILDIENGEICREVIAILEEVTQLPKKKEKAGKKRGDQSPSRP